MVMSQSFGRKPLNFAQQQSEMRADYQAAKESRFQRRRRVIQSGSGPDWHYRTQHDYMKIMEYARDMYRNDVVIGSIVDRAAINTIQGGALLDCDSGDKTFDEDVLGGWNEYAHNAENIDIAGEDTFADMETKAYTSAKVDGDIWPIGMDDGCLQFFEGHRVRTPSRTRKSIFQGVELGFGRKPIRVWVTNDDMQFDMTQTLVSDYTPYAVRDGNGVRRVFHVHTTTKKRFGQTRGVSAFAPIFDLIGMHDDIEFAAVLKQQLQNALIFFNERDADYDGGPDESVGESHKHTRRDGSVETIEGLGPGTMIKGKKGEKLKGFMPTVPGADFFPHVKLILTLMGINLGMPLVLVLMDASESNFSGWRGAFDQAKLGFRENQRQMIRRFNTPVFDFHLEMRSNIDSTFDRMLKKVRLQSLTQRQRWFTWHLPSWPYVQPLDDRMADLIAVANYQEAPSTNMAKNGLDYDREMTRGIKDRGKAIEMALIEAERLNELRKNLKLDAQPPVVWEQLYTPPQPKFVTQNVTESRDANQNTSTTGGNNASRT